MLVAVDLLPGQGGVGLKRAEGRGRVADPGDRGRHHPHQQDRARRRRGGQTQQAGPRLRLEPGRRKRRENPSEETKEKPLGGEMQVEAEERIGGRGQRYPRHREARRHFGATLARGVVAARDHRQMQGPAIEVQQETHRDHQADHPVIRQRLDVFVVSVIGIGRAPIGHLPEPVTEIAVRTGPAADPLEIQELRKTRAPVKFAASQVLSQSLEARTHRPLGRQQIDPTQRQERQ